MTDTLDLPLSEIEFKFASEAAEGTFSGYASIYGNVDLGRDIVMPGAFKSLLDGKGARPKLLWQHDPREVIGVWERFEEDQKGLKGYGRLLPETQRGREAMALLKADAIDGLSIGYRVLKDEYISGKGGSIRQIKEAELFEVSLVTFPMNPKALVTDVKQLQSPREVETILRNAGVPAAFAKLVANHGFDEAKSRLSKDQRDAGDGGDRVQAQLSGLLNEIRSLKEKINGKG